MGTRYDTVLNAGLNKSKDVRAYFYLGRRCQEIFPMRPAIVTYKQQQQQRRREQKKGTRATDRNWGKILEDSDR